MCQASKRTPYLDDLPPLVQRFFLNMNSPERSFSVIITCGEMYGKMKSLNIEINRHDSLSLYNVTLF